MELFTQTPSDSTGTSNPDSISDLIRHIEGLPSEGIYVAIAIGMLIFVIGWFGGGVKNTLKKVMACIILVTIVSVFSLPVAARMYNWLAPGLSPIGAFSVVYLIWSFYMVGMGISLYETLIVTADEARPN